MMRNRLLLAAAISLGLVGCVLKPVAHVTPSSQFAAEAGVGAPLPGMDSTVPAGALSPASEYGSLTLSVRWPQQTGYQTALLPTSTNALGITIRQGAALLTQEVITRLPGQTTATASLQLKAANNLSVEVKAYREADPDLATAVPIAQKSGTFNVTRSRNTSANLTLDPLNVPTVDAMSTNIGMTGDMLTLTGTHFGTGSVPVPLVSFNGILASYRNRVSDTEMTVQVPPWAKTGKLVVVADGVTSSSEAVFWVPKTIAIASTKENWDPSASTDRLVMFGKTLLFSATSTWDYKPGDTLDYGTPPSPTWVLSNPSAGTLDGAGLFTATRSYQVTDVSARVGSLQSSVQPVRLVADAPVIASLTPTNGGPSSSMVGGPKTNVTINGSGFGDGDNPTLRVFLGTLEIADYTRVSDSQITFQLPYGVVPTGNVKAVSYGVTSVNKPTFQVLQSLNLSPSGITVDVPLGGTYQYTVSGTDNNGNPVASPSVTWSSTATASATISQTGLLTAVDYGTAYPVVHSGSVQAWGAMAKIDYAYTVGSGNGNGMGSNSVYGLAAPIYYSQAFFAPSRTFKALDVGVAPADFGPLALEIRSDLYGAPSGTVIATLSATNVPALPGHVYAFDHPVSLANGPYHLIYKLPANTAHYLYYLTGGGYEFSLQSSNGSSWTSITTVPPNNPDFLFFRLGE